MDSTAVFEWETFLPLTDYSDKSLAEVFKRISRDIIERPYHYDPHHVFNAQGKEVQYTFTKANNSKSPEKIPGVAVYKQNHGTGHALRQAFYTEALIDKIVAEGNPKGQAIAKKINSHPELKSALKLAAYCKRIGRTFDHEKDTPGHTSIYSKRSAEMFAKMAKELGYSPDLIQVIRDGMLEPPPKDKNTLASYKEVAGIPGKDLRDFTKNVLMSAHMADLTRIFTVKRKYIETSLNDYFDPLKLKEVSTGLIEMGCKANAMTGNPVAQQEDGVMHKPTPLNGKKLVESVTNIDKTIDELAKLADLQKASPHVSKWTQIKAISEQKSSMLDTSIPPVGQSFFAQKVSSTQSILWKPTADQSISSQAISSVIQQMTKKSIITVIDSEIPLVSKGLMNGSFKIAFDTPEEAKIFRDLLNEGKFKSTYFGENEKYPMNHEGKILSHIVRFENSGEVGQIPEEALEFIKQKFDDNDKVADIVEKMGFERPQLQLGMRP